MNWFMIYKSMNKRKKNDGYTMNPNMTKFYTVYTVCYI